MSFHFILEDMENLYLVLLRGRGIHVEGGGRRQFMTVKRPTSSNSHYSSFSEMTLLHLFPLPDFGLLIGGIWSSHQRILLFPSAEYALPIAGLAKAWALTETDVAPFIWFCAVVIESVLLLKCTHSFSYLILGSSYLKIGIFYLKTWFS